MCVICARFPSWHSSAPHVELRRILTITATAALKQQCDFDSRTRRRPVSLLWRTELDGLFFLFPPFVPYF